MASPWPPRQKRQDVPPKVLEQLAKHPVKGLYQLIDNNSVYCPNPSRTTSLMNFIGRVQTPYREDAYEEGGSSEMSSRPNDGRISLNAFLFIRQQVGKLPIVVTSDPPLTRQALHRVGTASFPGSCTLLYRHEQLQVVCNRRSLPR